MRPLDYGACQTDRVQCIHLGTKNGNHFMPETEATALRLLEIRDRATPLPLSQWRTEGHSIADADAGYAIQAAAAAIRTGERGERRIGYKIGATNQLAKDMLGLTEPFFGRIFADTAAPSGTTWALREGIDLVAEPEIALRLGRNLPPAGARFDAAAMEDATEALLPVIEIVTCCFAPWTQAGAPLLTADNGAPGGWVHGAAVEDWTGFDPLETEVTAHGVADGPLTGAGRAVDGGPFGAAAWLANRLASQGIGLNAGDVISTGTVTAPIALDRGQSLSADFGALGSVSVQISG
jgi:2-keto-4-pentenoate hydratase